MDVLKKVAPERLMFGVIGRLKPILLKEGFTENE